MNLDILGVCTHVEFMLFVFFCNFLNHHQVLVADELYCRLQGQFVYVSTMPAKAELLKGGQDYSSIRQYCIRAFDSKENDEKALDLAKNADVCIFGADSLKYAIERAKYSKGLTFEVAERWLKRGVLNLCSPRLLRWLFTYHFIFPDKNWYKLCANSYTSQDDEKLLAYKNKHYKWGYFVSPKLNNVVKHSEDNLSVRILWCARFLRLKHPELVICLAARLKKEGYKILIDMLGDGEIKEEMCAFADKLCVSDIVRFHGSVSNDDVNKKMAESDIFLFTSDKREGWGVVMNEAMNNECCVVASDAIGSTHFLVNDGETGVIFKSCNIESLYEKVKWLLDNPEERIRIAKQGYKSITEIWSPHNAVKNLLALIDDLKNGKETPITVGPCSKA